MITQTERILVVDDNYESLSHLQLILEKAGYHVYTALDGDMALQVLHRESIELILTDVVMPNMNGYQLHEAVRDNPGWDLIPFILISGLIHPRDLRFGKEMGVDDYLVKPITAETLLSVVRGKLRRVRQFRDQLALARLRADES
jgi:DNA-binding response OmpR family regulator